MFTDLYITRLYNRIIAVNGCGQCLHFVHINLNLWTKTHNLYENSEDTESTKKTFLSTLVISREKIKSFLEKTNRYLYPKKLDNLIVDIYI